MSRSASILVVEDSPTQAMQLQLLLEREGWEVACVPDGQAARRRLQEGRPTLLVVDYHLPDLRGDLLCLEIRRDEQMVDLPILLLTADQNEAIQLKGLQSGADDHVHKSVDSELLLLRIRSLLRKGEVASLARELAQANRELQEINLRLKEAQAQLVQSEKMASLGQLVAGIAHEINNPLAFALNNLYSVRTTLDKVRPLVQPQVPEAVAPKWDKLPSQLADMQTGLERVRDLILKLRTFSRLDEGEFKTVDIHESIDSVLMILQHRLEGRIEVVRNYGPIQQVSCYAGELNQVLMNLVANAIDAIEGEGKIIITTGLQEGLFSIAVRDTGRGIPKSIRHRLFEPFFTTKPVGQGMGLGLAIAYGVIRRHRGEIEIRSGEGEGSEFIIKFPLDLEGST